MLPELLLQSLEGVTGFDRASFEAAHGAGNQLTSVRLNPFKPVELHDGWDALPVSWCPYGYYLPVRPSFTLDPLFHAGAYYVQEASSMFLWHVLGETSDRLSACKVLDLCAAPGGKSTLLASWFVNGLVVSNEAIRPRASVLAENMTKWGTESVVVTNNDPSHFGSLPAFFDVMVVDAPCSGSGLFRKDPEAIGEWSEDNVLLCSQRQQRILADALPALKEDGLLVYATCSYSPAEDEEIVEWLVNEMGMESARIPVPGEWNIVETIGAGGNAYGYRFYPGKAKGEGFFIAAFRKRSGDTHGRIKEHSLAMAGKPESQMVKGFVPLSDENILFRQGDAIRTIAKKWQQAVQQLAGALYIKKAGIEIGAVKGKDLIPSHELAMSLLSLDGFPSVEVDTDAALQYLRRQDISLPVKPGWTLLRFKNLPLGWAKVLPNRVNNYYPAEWRILKT